MCFDVLRFVLYTMQSLCVVCLCVVTFCAVTALCYIACVLNFSALCNDVLCAECWSLLTDLCAFQCFASLSNAFQQLCLNTVRCSILCRLCLRPLLNYKLLFGMQILFCTTLIKKKIKFSSYIWNFRMEQLQSHIWLTASSYTVWWNICAFPQILGSPSSYMTLQLLHCELLIFEENLQRTVPTMRCTVHCCAALCVGAVFSPVMKGWGSKQGVSEWVGV